MIQEQKILYNKIDEILWKDWDPIGVNYSPEARDEYQSYTPQLFKLKIEGADKETIANYLNKIVMEEIGLHSNLEHCREIAEQILKA